MIRGVLLAVVGLASVASAGVGDGDLVVNVDFADDSIGIGESTTAVVTATFTGWGPAAYFSSITADLIASGDFVSITNLAGLDWANPALGTVNTGEPDGSSINNVFGAQLSLFPPVDDSNPLLLLSFTVTGTAAGVLFYSAVPDADVAAPGAFSVTDPFGGPFQPPPGFGGEALVSESLTITPASPGLVVVGVGGLGFARRRRWSSPDGRTGGGW